jgi:lipopolysaccharide/colanic/teichoic acid biosynthesis glycosyltransferase
MYLLWLVLGALVLLVAITAIDTQSNGFFYQNRIGRHNKTFIIYKLRTLHSETQQISNWGKYLRKTKIDELPQLINILKGEMTFVGPRPDVPGYADQLSGENRIILNLKPGLTGLASLKYHNEERLLNLQINPQQYNDEVIWPDKVRINKWYAQNRTLIMDLQIIFYTLFSNSFDVDSFIEKRKK